MLEAPVLRGAFVAGVLRPARREALAVVALFALFSASSRACGFPPAVAFVAVAALVALTLTGGSDFTVGLAAFAALAVVAVAPLRLVTSVTFAAVLPVALLAPAAALVCVVRFAELAWLAVFFVARDAAPAFPATTLFADRDAPFPPDAAAAPVARFAVGEGITAFFPLVVVVFAIAISLARKQPTENFPL
ncbi:hypothetical protein AB870_02875 [Pandoraea faecigallinarum]|uniref:Uncharacterized protein n=1 Tax=Pandoraea faecigallinarum TaxID=656179 RepID=A0A0H3WN01_9BURK|nr:hypothetical protein AB870_02875 [Pandoraea faecigallinarum]